MDFLKKSNSIWTFSPRQSPSPETTVLSVSSMSESDSKWSYPPQRKTQLSAQHLNIIPATLCTVRDAYLNKEPNRVTANISLIRTLPRRN